MDHLWTPWRYAYVTQPKDSEGVTPREGVPAALEAWLGDYHCVFCNLIAAADYAVAHGTSVDDADRSANIVLRGEHCYVCLNAFPYSSGHVMIVPYAHLAALTTLPAATAQEMMTLAQRVAGALESTYHPDGLNLGLNQGKAAGAGVAGHLHLHALPRWVGDTNFMTTVSETRILPELLEQTWQRLRQALA